MADLKDWPREAFGGVTEVAPKDQRAKYQAAIERIRQGAILNIGPSIADVVLVHNYAESRPAPAERLSVWLSMGPTEMGNEPAIYMDSPTDGDPLILATMKRVHREDLLHEALQGVDISREVQWQGAMAAANNVIDGLQAELDDAHTALEKAEGFLTGFEDDRTQEDVSEYLQLIRAAISRRAVVKRAVAQ